MKTVWIIIVIGGVLVAGIWLARLQHSKGSVTPKVDSGWRYIAVGDSYTIGQGVAEGEAWPNLLAKDLSNGGIKTSLVANLARTGYTTQDAIDNELTVFEQEKPDFGTLLIGVNDLVQGVDGDKFRSNLGILMGRMAAALPRQDRLLVVTIPDLSATPAGAQLVRGKPGELSAAVSNFNGLIKAEADAKGLRVADIFALSQEVKNEPKLVAADGLHPSAKEYVEWEKLIYPMAAEILSK